MKAPARIRALICIGLAGLLLCVSLTGCNPTRKAYVQRLEQLGKGGAGAEESIDELKKAVAMYQAEVDKKISAAQNLGAYHKLLALRYLDNDMYGLALQSFRDAIEIYPENGLVFYYAAVTAARMAKAEVTDPVKAAQFFAWSEDYYTRAITLDPTNANALYGLAVLYALELGRQAEAEPLLEGVLAIEKKNAEAMFLLARVYYGQGRLEEAAELYDRIIQDKPSERLVQSAEENKATIERELYGSK